MRSAAAAHPWFAELIGGRPTLGPGALAHLETTLGALGSAAGFKDIDDALQAFDTLNAYVIGAIQSEHSTVRAEAQSGMDPNEWQAASRPYLERLIATGEHPILERSFVKRHIHGRKSYSIVASTAYSTVSKRAWSGRRVVGRPAA